MAEIYISTDVETNGPIPGVYSMLSFGSAAFNLDKEILSTFSANLEVLPGAIEDEDTMQWWDTQKDAWIASRKNPKNPQIAMKEYLSWLKELPGEPVFLGYPASFDFMFISWYLYKFTKENPFSYLALDIKTFAWAILKKPFFQITKSNMPKDWFDRCDKTHVALDDAIEQGLLFCNMVAKTKEK